MMRAKQPVASEPRAPADFLRLALEARDPGSRARHAEAGLAAPEHDADGPEHDPRAAADTRLLLLRQLYLACLEQRRLPEAAEIARRIARDAGADPTLASIARADEARALAALGDLDGAIRAQRLAARAAPPDRRVFHLFCLATLQHFAGETGTALDTIARARRWARADAVLLRALEAHVLLESGELPEGLEALLRALRQDPSREGYGEYLLGMILLRIGDPGAAATSLRAFLRRNASADVPKQLTLQEELRRARSTLASLESA